ncbi:MAG: hypothetical protein OEZ65_08435 [Gemmatimonadota bacterium]|nr:hypothetical protein [Gemmatimonadota bacterium]
MKTMKRWFIRPVAAGMVLLGAAACDDATGPGALDDAVLADMALIAADAVIEDVAVMGLSLGAGPMAAAGMEGMFQSHRVVTFYDADGNEMSAYDPLLTDYVHFLLDIDREVSRDGWTATISRSRDMIVSGLLGEEEFRTWNGTGEEDISRSRHLEDGTVRNYDLNGTFTKEDVVVPAPGAESRWPVSGTITRHLEVTIDNGVDEPRVRVIDVVITFNGTSVVTAVVNGETFEIDLATLAGRNPVRRHHGG